MAELGQKVSSVVPMLSIPNMFALLSSLLRKLRVCFVGGASKGCISLHSLASGKRLTQNALPKECNFLTYASFRIEGL